MIPLDKKQALLYSANQPSVAHQLNNKYSVQEYYDIVEDVEYLEFYSNHIKQFYDSYEGALLWRLSELTNALRSVSYDNPQYSKLNKEFNDTLKITTPLLERLAKISKEVQVFEGLEIKIYGEEEN